MLAGLLLNLPRPDGDAPRNRRQRRDYAKALKEHHRKRLEEYLLKQENDKALTAELATAYKVLTGEVKAIERPIPEAAKVKAVKMVAPFRSSYADSPINFANMAVMKEDAKALLTLYYDVLDEDLLIILAEGA